MADKRNSDFSVGYGKPPVHSRFPKGKSGNPKGRPWAYKNMSALLNEVLSSMYYGERRWQAKTDAETQGDAHPARQ